MFGTRYIKSEFYQKPNYSVGDHGSDPTMIRVEQIIPKTNAFVT